MALSAAAGLTTRNTTGKTVLEPTIETGKIIYQHALCVVTAAGIADPADNVVASEYSIGIALDSSTGVFPVTGDGTKTVDCYVDIEVLLPLESAITVGNEMENMYAFDDNRVTDLTTRGNAVGILTEFVAANSGYVYLGKAALAVSS